MRERFVELEITFPQHRFCSLDISSRAEQFANRNRNCLSVWRACSHAALVAVSIVLLQCFVSSRAVGARLRSSADTLRLMLNKPAYCCSSSEAGPRLALLPAGTLTDSADAVAKAIGICVAVHQTLLACSQPSV